MPGDRSADQDGDGDMDMTGAIWRKPSYSSNGGDTCVEVANVWRKSSYSSNGGATCVEAAITSLLVAVRDSKDPDGPGWRSPPVRGTRSLGGSSTGGLIWPE